MSPERLFALIKSGEIDTIKTLINENFEYATLTFDTQKSLMIHYASEYGCLELVQFLWEKNSDLIHVTDTLGQSPLLWAAAKGHEHVVDYLAKKGADLNLKTSKKGDNYNGYAAIHWACEGGHHKVIQCLILHNADIHVRVGIIQLHPIHIAAQNGRLEGVKLLLNHSPDILNIIDSCGRTPLFWAAANGYTDIVQYLLENGADLTLMANCPSHKDHGKTALDCAMQNEHYEAANILILKINAHQPKEAILPFITSARQAFELMLLEPTMIDMLLNHERIKALLYTETHNSMSTGSSRSWYKVSGRRPSWFAHIDTETKTPFLFEPVSELGRGVYGSVRLFQDKKSKMPLAVKSAHTPIRVSDTNFSRQRQKLQMEAEFNKVAYPEDNISLLFEFTLRYGEEYIIRQLTAYAEGNVARTFLSNQTCPQVLAKGILKLAQELHRLHANCKIIHGDIHGKNILVNYKDEQLTVRFVDFGKSHYINTRQLIGGYSRGHIQFYAPELYDGPRIKPHINQDIYAFGFLLNSNLKDHSTASYVNQFFPSIQSFIAAALSKEPTARPSLEVFCQELSAELVMRKIPEDEWPENKQEAKPSVQLGKALIALAKSSKLTEAQEKLLADVLDNPCLITWKFEAAKGSVVPNFLTYALLYSQPEVVSKLKAHKQWHVWLQYKHPLGYTLLHLMALNNSCYAYRGLHTEFDINDAKNNKQDTALHCAAQRGNTTFCHLLLENGANPSLKNKAGKTPAECWPNAKKEVSPFTQLKEKLILLATNLDLLKAQQGGLLTKNSNLATWEFAPKERLCHFLFHVLEHNKPEVIAQFTTHKAWYSCREKHLEQKKAQILELLKPELPQGIEYFFRKTALSELYQKIVKTEFSSSTPLTKTSIDLLHDTFQAWLSSHIKQLHINSLTLDNTKPSPIESLLQKIIVILNPELAPLLQQNEIEFTERSLFSENELSVGSPLLK